MTKMIIYKEWLKSRWAILSILLVFAGVTFYSFLNLAKVVEFRGAAILWSTLVFKDTVLLETFRYLPLAAGAILATVQFVPETKDKRLKLTLHLPCPETRMVGTMLSYGLLVLFLIFCFQALCSVLILKTWLVQELILRILRTTLVWYLAGLFTYIWVAALCLEPGWKMRAFIFVVFAGAISLFFLSPVPEAYNGLLPYLALYAVLSIVLVGGSIQRFKEGYQD